MYPYCSIPHASRPGYTVRMTYPMDEDTREYIDGRFARLEHEKVQDKDEAIVKLASHRKRMKRVVYACAAILVILAIAEFGLLYWAQFSSR